MNPMVEVENTQQFGIVVDMVEGVARFRLDSVDGDVTHSFDIPFTWLEKLSEIIVAKKQIRLRNANRRTKSGR